jgi:hypothetical protein
MHFDDEVAGARLEERLEGGGSLFLERRGIFQVRLLRRHREHSEAGEDKKGNRDRKGRTQHFGPPQLAKQGQNFNILPVLTEAIML